MIRTIYLRDGTVIAGEPRMGAPSGPMTYVVENEDGWHTIMVDVVARVVDSQDDQGRCGAIGPLVDPPKCEHDWRSLPIDGDAASRGMNQFDQCSKCRMLLFGWDENPLVRSRLDSRSDVCGWSDVCGGKAAAIPISEMTPELRGLLGFEEPARGKDDA